MPADALGVVALLKAVHLTATRGRGHQNEKILPLEDAAVGIDADEFQGEGVDQSLSDSEDFIGLNEKWDYDREMEKILRGLPKVHDR